MVPTVTRRIAPPTLVTDCERQLASCIASFSCSSTVRCSFSSPRGSSFPPYRFAGLLQTDAEFVPAYLPFTHLSAHASGTASTRFPCRSRRALGPSPSVGLLPLRRGPTATNLAAPFRSSPRSNPPTRSAGRRSLDRHPGRD